MNNNKDVVTEDGYVETTITQSWNTDTEVYVDSYKKVITYDENNRILDTANELLGPIKWVFKVQDHYESYFDCSRRLPPFVPL